MSDQQKTRLEWIDIAKGIAMISILLQHLKFVNSTGGSLFSSYVGQYHVPVFLVVAGCFLSASKPLDVFVRDKIRRLLAPYALTCSVIGLILLCRKLFGMSLLRWKTMRGFMWSVLYGAGANFSSLPDGVSFIGAIWFLEALFVALVEVRLLLGLFADKPAMLLLSAILLALGATSLAKITYLPCNLEQGLLSGLYVSMGYLYRKYVGLSHRASIEAVLILAFVFLFAADNGIRPTIAGAQIKGGALCLVVSLCACLLVFAVSQAVEGYTTYLSRFLSYYGRNSLVLLCVHLILQDIAFRQLLEGTLGSIAPSAHQNFVCGINLCVQLSLTALTVHALRKTRFLKGIFLT